MLSSGYIGNGYAEILPGRVEVSAGRSWVPSQKFELWQKLTKLEILPQKDEKIPAVVV